MHNYIWFSFIYIYNENNSQISQFLLIELIVVFHYFLILSQHLQERTNAEQKVPKNAYAHLVALSQKL